jgi:hypothetical protein
VDDFAIRLQDACLQPLADEAQKGVVVDPPLQQLDQFFMVDFVEGLHDTIPITTT